MARIVIDANLAVATALPLPYSELATQQMEVWQNGGDELLAPALWSYEILSALRKAVVAKVITHDEVRDRLEAILELGVREIMPTLELHQQTLQWAGRLGQNAAYDGAYLALAEHFSADFWTGDRRLVNNAHQVGAKWVHWIGEVESAS